MFQEDFNYWTVITPIGVAVISAIPGLFLYWREKRKHKVNIAKDEFDYIQVSQGEILNLYQQIKEISKEFLIVEHDLSVTKQELEDCKKEHDGKLNPNISESP